MQPMLQSTLSPVIFTALSSLPPSPPPCLQIKRSTPSSLHTETHARAHTGVHFSRCTHPRVRYGLCAKVRRTCTSPCGGQRVGGKLRGGAWRMAPAGPVYSPGPALSTEPAWPLGGISLGLMVLAPWLRRTRTSRGAFS